jgi:hypothetical protein
MLKLCRPLSGVDPGVLRGRRGRGGVHPFLFAKQSLKLTVEFWNLENVVEI